MRQIAETAGISKALVYHCFPSKSALFKAAVAHYATELQPLRALDGDGPAGEQLSRTLDAYLNRIDANAPTWTQTHANP